MSSQQDSSFSNDLLEESAETSAELESPIRSKSKNRSRKSMIGEPSTNRPLRARTPSLKAIELMATSESSTRRSSRKSIPTKRFEDSFSRYDKKKRDRNTRSVACSESESSGDEDVMGKAIEHTEVLFEEAKDVEGQQLFGFRTPKKRNAMCEMAAATPKTSERKKQQDALGTRTPQSSKKISKQDLITKTPSSVRSRVKHELSKLIKDETDSDFSSDQSEYMPKSSDSSSSEETDKENDSNEQTGMKQTPKKSSKSFNAVNTPSTRARDLRSKRRGDYIPESDSYFNTHSSSKAVTSDHTLHRLKTPRLPSDRLFELLKSMELSAEHKKCVRNLTNDHKMHFEKWLTILNEGFNILLYGLGSKKNLLQSFHNRMLTKHHVVVVNGFFPSLTIIQILDSIANDILQLALNSSNLHEIVDAIEEDLAEQAHMNLFLIVHNIDGTMLRNSKSQDILSRLARIENIHLLASIDHINAPLLWDHAKLSNYNFSWWDATTMLPYTEETAFENSLLVQNSGELALSSMKNVFQSLTTNARGIFMILVKHQLKNKTNSTYQGMPFKDLYRGSREGFLVSSDMALRTQLTEFLDHKLVKSKRTVDGTEHLTIPINHILLQQFTEQPDD